MHHQSQSVCVMPDVFSEGKGYSCFFFWFALIQTRWYQRAQKLESPLENVIQSRSVTRADSTGIRCLLSEPRTCSWAFLFSFFFSSTRLIFVMFLSHQEVPTARFCLKCGNVRKRHQFKLVAVLLLELPRTGLSPTADGFVLLSDL